MAVQNISQRSGGTANALGISAPTLLKSGAGTFWNLNVNQAGSSPGYLCDSATIAGAGPANAILTIPAVGGSAPTAPLDGPFNFSRGLVFLPNSADLNVSVAFA